MLLHPTNLAASLALGLQGCVCTEFKRRTSFPSVLDPLALRFPATHPPLQHLRPRQRQVVPPVPPEDAGTAHRLLPLHLGPGEWSLYSVYSIWLPLTQEGNGLRTACSRCTSGLVRREFAACSPVCACPASRAPPALPVMQHYGWGRSHTTQSCFVSAGPAVRRLPVCAVWRARGGGAGQAG